MLTMTGPGIFSGIPLHDYHSAGICPGPSVSSSDLRNLWVKRSPAHFYVDWRCNPNRKPPKPSREMILGSAAHHLLLGEDDFSTHYIVHPDKMPDQKGAMKPWSLQLGSAKLWVEQQVAAGKEVISPEDLETIRRMARSLGEHPLIEAGLLNGMIEQSMCCLDKETGLWLQARPDAIPTDSGDYGDLKSISDVLDVTIKTTLRARAYHQQAALTWEICDQLKLPFASWSLVFSETDEPFCSRIVEIPEDDLNRGRRQNRAMIYQIADCLAAGKWPGPGSDDADPFWLPKTDQEYIDQRLEKLERARETRRESGGMVTDFV